jgi:hypothetical protein
MRIVVSLAIGVIAGYALHMKKDESIDSIANGIVDIIMKKRKTVADRFSR